MSKGLRGGATRDSQAAQTSASIDFRRSRSNFRVERVVLNALPKLRLRRLISCVFDDSTALVLRTRRSILACEWINNPRPVFRSRT